MSPQTPHLLPTKPLSEQRSCPLGGRSPKDPALGTPFPSSTHFMPTPCAPHTWEPVKPGIQVADASLPCLWLHAQPVTGTPSAHPAAGREPRGEGGRCSGLAEGGSVPAGPGEWRAYRSSCSRRGEGLWRILLWASAWSMPCAFSPLMARITSPGLRSAASALPRSVTCPARRKQSEMPCSDGGTAQAGREERGFPSVLPRNTEAGLHQVALCPPLMSPSLPFGICPAHTS